MFSTQRGHVVVNEDMPFKVVQAVDRGCLFGRDLHKVQDSRSARQEKDAEWSAATFQRKKVKLQGTKKKGCTAMMHVKQVELFPEFRIDISEQCSKWQHETASKEVMSRLRLALQEESSDKPVLRQHRFYVCMSDRESHCNHDIDARCAGYAQPINSEVSKKICELVQQGVTSVKTVESCLRFFVRDVLFSNKLCPPTTCRDFYPTKTDIKNHIQKTLRKDRYSSIDQENVAMYLEQMIEKAPGTRCLFRPYHVKSMEHHSEGQEEPLDELPYCDALETVAQKCEQTLLLCIQTEFMRELMLKYSDDVVCLDATYKTTDYALPLFLIVVKTASSYAIAGAFMVQFETADSIEEALNTFKAWNPTLSPKFWMVDYSQAEISALSAAFPNSRPVLCDFHREQAWQRWI
ncbi:uncharacterized protein [Dermacentor albipictus]|uniref:uncharacterized protein n=1 Tax=Dermacentor albipictus TaxID=60249 RepID=UPI0038FC815D